MNRLCKNLLLVKLERAFNCPIGKKEEREIARAHSEKTRRGGLGVAGSTLNEAFSPYNIYDERLRTHRFVHLLALLFSYIHQWEPEAETWRRRPGLSKA